MAYPLAKVPNPASKVAVFRSGGLAVCLLGVGLSAMLMVGCGRAHYRRQADWEVYGLIESGTTDPRWPLDDYTIEPDPSSRFYDPYSPDRPPMPPDDPTSHQLMHYVDGKRNWPYERHYGCTDQVENPEWMLSLLPYLETKEESGEEAAVVLDREAAMTLALLHSREYQQQLENLYLSALDVTLERFRFDTQFFGGNSTFFDVAGPLSGGGASSSALSTDTDGRMRRLMATGGELLVSVANSVVWEFSGADGYVATTPLSFSLLQPLLRGAGRAVVLEQLTSSERALLADIRQLERFRREFYIQIIAGGGARAGAFLGLLRDEVQIRNQQRNVVALKDSLRQVELNFEEDPEGRTRADSVELTRQRLYAGQSRLVGVRADYQTALDSYKITLGLPPDLPMRVDDPLLERFNLMDPAMTALQDTVNALQDQLSQLSKLKQPMPTEDQIRTGAIRQECLGKLEMVEHDLELLLEALPERRKALQELSAREEFQQGAVDPSLADVAGLHMRVVTWHMDYYGAGDPYVKELADELLTLPEQQEEFRNLVRKRQDAGVEGVAVALGTTLARLEAFEQDPVGTTAAANAELEQEKTPTEVLAERVTQLSRELLRLSVVQARARLDAITLVPIHLDPEEALQIARANRRDWMNARAALVDTWRQIELRADDLKSDLDIVFSGDVTTRSATFGINNTTGSLRAGLEFDAPLTRLAERNAYRRALISYQQARRNYYAFEDNINQSLRSLLRTIRLSQLDFEIARGSVSVAIMRVDLARRELENPTPSGGGIAGTRELVDSLDALLVEQNSFASAWVEYEAQRMQLDLDLGTMQLDDRGMWIDPGPIQGQPVRRPEQIPAPQPEVQLDLDFPPLDDLPPLKSGDRPALDIALEDMPGAYDADHPRRAVRRHRLAHGG